MGTSVFPAKFIATRLPSTVNMFLSQRFQVPFVTTTPATNWFGAVSNRRQRPLRPAPGACNMPRKTAGDSASASGWESLVGGYSAGVGSPIPVP